MLHSQSTRIYRFKYEVDEAYPWIFERDDSLPCQHGPLLENKPIKSWEPLEVVADDPESPVGSPRKSNLKLPDVATYHTAVAVSERVRDAIEPITGEHCQFLPLLLPDQVYYGINPITTIAALDPSSEIKRFQSSGRIMRIDRFVLRLPELLDDWPAMFRLSNGTIGPMFVTGAVRDVIRENKFTGAMLAPMEVIE